MKKGHEEGPRLPATGGVKKITSFFAESLNFLCGS
jgi:hypothetical protein